MENRIDNLSSMTIVNAERLVSAQGRSRLFWLLAEALLRGFQTEVVSGIKEQEDTAAVAPNDPLSAAWRNLVAALDNLGGDDWEQRLAVEHTRLFAGLQPVAGSAPPFESAWRPDHEPGEVAHAVQQAYAAAGFADIDIEAGPQDHLAVELKFIALLAWREAEVWRQGNEADAASLIQQQLTFFDRCLDWVPRWVDSLAGQTREPVYRALMDMIRTGLTQAAEDLKEAGAVMTT